MVNEVLGASGAEGKEGRRYEIKHKILCVFFGSGRNRAPGALPPTLEPRQREGRATSPSRGKALPSRRLKNLAIRRGDVGSGFVLACHRRRMRWIPDIRDRASQSPATLATKTAPGAGDDRAGCLVTSPGEGPLNAAMATTVGAPPYTTVLDLRRRLKCRECRWKGRAEVSIECASASSGTNKLAEMRTPFAHLTQSPRPRPNC
jgi:hypothetical protein